MSWFKQLLRQDKRQGETTSIADGHRLDAEAYFKQGVEFGQARRDKEALEAFDAAVRLSPDFAQAHFNRAIALRSLNRLEEALAAYDEVIRLKPGEASAAALFEKGEVLTKLGRWEDAAAAFDRLLALHPGYAPALERRSPILGILGRFEDAARDRERARRIRDQQNKPIASNLIFICRNSAPCEQRADLCEAALREFVITYPGRWTRRPKISVDKSTDQVLIDMAVDLNDIADLEGMRTTFNGMLVRMGFSFD